MKTHIKHVVLFFVFLFLVCSLNAQYTWPSAIDYMFKGNIKTFTILNNGGTIVAKEAFNNEYDQMTYVRKEDSIRNSGRISPWLLSYEYEKVYPFVLVSVDSTVKMKFNGRGQLLERQAGNVHEWNTFSEDGKIIAHIRSETFSEMVVGGGVKSRKPKKLMSDYIFSNTVSSITIFKYNNYGSLLEFEYYHTDPDKNFRITNIYDLSNNLVERDRYDHQNISWKLLKEDYLEKFIHTDISNLFLIDTYYPDYWCEGAPQKEVWRYNETGQKTHYMLYNDHHNSVGFIAKWYYRQDGSLMEEWHYYVFINSPEQLKCVMEFDKCGNVVSEARYTDFSHDGFLKYKFEYY